MCRKQPNNPQILISDKLSKFPVSGWASGGYVDCATTISWTPAATVALYCLVVQLEESWCIVEEKPYNIDICPTILGHCVRCGVHNHCNGDALFKKCWQFGWPKKVAMMIMVVMMMAMVVVMIRAIVAVTMIA